jgi:thioesterase domain-containing protein/acyl carrier protein
VNFDTKASEPGEETSTAACEQLVDCFEQVFQVEALSPQDDFFELGGDSLAAAQLLVEIEKRFGVRLPPTILIEYPVISDLAEAIGQETGTHFKPAVIPIKASGTLPPIYMPHGHSGNLWVAYNLARHLSADQPLYGISPDFNQVEFYRFEELAAQAVKTLVTEHPRQDYQLVGYSFGGILAYEMARQLQAGGKDVAYLGIIDSAPDMGSDLRSAMRPDMREKRARLRERYRDQGLYQTALWSVQWLKRRFSSEPPKVAETEPPVTISDFEQAAVGSFLEYRPGTYAGDITVFVTDQDSNSGQSATADRWRQIVSGQVERVAVEGDHYSIRQSPHIRQIAARLGG